MVRETWNKNRPDGAIRKAVEDALSYDPRVKAFDISTQVDNGKVVLEGKVDNISAKFSAGEDARNTVGVTSVTNNIEVAQKVVVRPDLSFTDLAIQKRAEQQIARSELLENAEINVKVENGVASLEGTVDSSFEKKRATQILQEVVGLTLIENSLKVKDNS